MTSLSDLIRVFGRIGLLSFGGPAAQIALMHKELVDERPWLTEAQFLRALSFCMLLPGPEAMQLATYAGWRLRGIPGGLIGGGLFVLPGAFVIAALAAIYLHFGAAPALQGAFLGVQAAVVIIILQAIWRLSRKALKSARHLLIAALAFLALFAFGLPFPLVIAAAALIGALGPVAEAEPRPLPPLRRALAPALIFGALWALPLLALALAGSEGMLALGLFFSKMSVVSFGGAYALLAYMAQEIVNAHQWLSMAQMMDALGLAETTPGPLILVTQFVGHLAGAELSGWGGFALGGMLTLWVTFVPCFLWIFAGAPLIDWLEGQPRLSAALAGISAAVVGVIANLSLWFALHLLFGELSPLSFGPAEIPLPRLASLSLPALGLVALAGLLIFALRRGLPLSLALCALAGLGLSFASI